MHGGGKEGNRERERKERERERERERESGERTGPFFVSASSFQQIINWQAPLLLLLLLSLALSLLAILSPPSPFHPTPHSAPQAMNYQFTKRLALIAN